MMEKAGETGVRLGTTSRGIGPTYEDKMGRRGIRVADLFDNDSFCQQIRQAVREKNLLAKALNSTDSLSETQVVEEYAGYVEMLRPLARDTAALLGRELARGAKLLCEGAQATMLDIDHGTYPYVTSSNTTAGGVCNGLGLSPTAIGAVLGVSKAYCTRVGAGPFLSEAHGPEGDELRSRGKEFGAVTGRPRRCGWFDIPVMRYARLINGFQSVVITKLDVLDHLAQIPVCTGYRYKGALLEEMPATIRELEAVEPVYESRPGWCSPTEGLTSYQQLPQKARDYLKYLSDAAEVEITLVSTGPERAQTMWVPGTRLAREFGQ
jgi:adenylosuccinate synthase